MSFDHLLSLVNHVPLAALDGLSRDVWRATGEGALTEAQAQTLAEAIHGRRRPALQASVIALGCLTAVSSQRPSVAPSGAPGTPAAKEPRLWSYFPVKQPQHTPDRARSMERRRILAASGPMPPKLACLFTTGELAILKIVSDTFVLDRQCTLSISEIAARAGMGHTKTRLALRIAQNAGLLSITERRVQYRPNLTNVVRIVSPTWLGWLSCRKPRSKASEKAGGDVVAPRVDPPGRRGRGGGFTFEKATESRVYEKRDDKSYNQEVIRSARSSGLGSNAPFPPRKWGP